MNMQEIQALATFFVQFFFGVDILWHTFHPNSDITPWILTKRCIVRYHWLIVFYIIIPFCHSSDCKFTWKARKKRISSPEYFEMLNGTEIHSQNKNKRMIIKLIWDKIASFDDIIKISQIFLKTSVNLKWKHKLLFRNLRLVHVFWAQWHIWHIRHEEQ